MLFLAGQAFVGKEQNTSSPKKARVGCYKNPDDWVQDLSRQLGQLCKFKRD